MGKETEKMPDYIVYTDGGCENGGAGGIGVVSINTRTSHVREFSRGYRSSTNNRMEMMAVLIALQSIPDGSRVSLYSDSQYTLNCLNGAWKKQKNLDLWTLVDREAKGKILDLHWIKGHDGNKYNERCDELATIAIRSKMNWDIDEGYEGKTKESKNYSKQLQKRLKKRENGGAMGVAIEIPEEIEDAKPDITDLRSFAAEHGIKEICAKNIMDFYQAESMSFKTYMNLKTSGIDTVSRMNRWMLIEKCGDNGSAARIISDHIEDQRDAMSALRWHVRGLTIKDAIRKVLVDMEVRENCGKN